MQNKKSNSKRLLTTALAFLIVVSAASASIMTGCGSSEDTKETSVVTETQIETKIVEFTQTVTDENGSTVAATDANDSSDSSSKADGSSSKSSSSSSSSKTSSSSKSDNSSSSKSSGSSSSKSSSSNNATHSSTKVCTVDGTKYYVGDTVTCTYNLTSPAKLINYQAFISFDKKYLKVKDAKLSKPASASGIVNFQNGKGIINFNGSNISSGYDYTKGGEFLVVTYEVLAEGSTKTTFNWEVACDFADDTKNYVSNGKPASGLKISQKLS